MLRPLPCLALSLLAGATNGCGQDGAAAAEWLPAPPATESMPPSGSFRIRWLPEEMHPVLRPIPGISAGSGRSELRSWLQVDYAGPKPHLEFYVVDRIGTDEPTETVLLREKFGTADMETEGGHTRYFEAEPFTRPRQGFFLRWFALRDCGENNAMLSVLSWDAVRRDLYSADQATFYAAALDPQRIRGSYSFGEGPLRTRGQRIGDAFVGPDRTLPDDSSIVLLRRSSENGVRTEVRMRFVE